MIIVVSFVFLLHLWE